MDKNVAVIGGIAVDIEGIPYQPLLYKDSNPGNIRMSFGGVGRNIAENLKGLGLSCEMVSAVGLDLFGKNIIRHLKEIGLSTKYIDQVEGLDTAVYLSILNDNRDMEVAINGMDIFSEWRGNKAIYESETIMNASVIVMDANLSRELIEELLSAFKGKTFVLDPVSVSKGKKLKDIIGEFPIIKPNLFEAEALSGIPIKREEDLSKAGAFFCDKGVEKVFITLGREGVYYREGFEKEGILPGKPILPVSATGAGDAFTAGIVYGFLKDFPIEKIAQYGSACSHYALRSEKTVNDKMTEGKIKKYVEENY